MKALVYTGPESLEIRQVPDPQLHEGDALIQVEAVGICGSDMHAYLGHDDRRPAPLILGHEAAGTVIDGPVQWVGKRVTVNPLVTNPNSAASKAGKENICPDRQIISMPPREGAFAQQLAMPVQNLMVVPDHVTAVQACLVEPVACGWHALRLCALLLGRLADANVLVIGGGAIGMGAALAARAQGYGAVTVAETNDLRHDALRGQGFDVVSKVADGQQFHCVVDAVGFEATRALASAVAAPGGVIAHIGLGGGGAGLDVRRMTLQEIAFLGTYTYTKRDFRETANALFDGSLGDLSWIEERSLADGPQAFVDMRNNKLSVPKVVLQPQAI
ncbi:MAG: alcohol dehydrogenase catalytic domain-containing protein [Pseudomonadota bacterium]